MLSDELVINKYSTLLKAMFDSKLNDDSSFTNSYSFELTKSKFKFILHEPSTSILNYEFKNKIEQIITTGLFPAFVIEHTASLDLIPLENNDPDSARALVWNLHFGLYKRLIINSITKDLQLFSNGHTLGIALMNGYLYFPDLQPHLAVQSVTTGGKTSLLMYLLANSKAFAEQKVKNGAIDDGVNSVIIIDPKRDPRLLAFAKTINAEYLAPDFNKSDADFVQRVCDKLTQVNRLSHRRALDKEDNPDKSYKDVFVTIDELLAIPEMANKKQKDLYNSLINRLLLMSASTNIHIFAAAQSFLAGATISSQARLQFSTKILLAPRVTTENAAFLFKDLDKDTIDNLIIDSDSFGSLGVGIISDGKTVVPLKVPYLKEFGNKNV